jgi:hypothetical protein
MLEAGPGSSVRKLAVQRAAKEAAVIDAA